MSLLIRTPVLPIVGNEVLDVPEIKLIDGDNDIVRYIPLKERNSVTHRIQHPLIKKIESRVSSELVEVEKTPSTPQSALLLQELKTLIENEDKKIAAARYISQAIRQHREALATKATTPHKAIAKGPILPQTSIPLKVKANAADSEENTEAKREAARVIRYHIYLAREAEKEALVPVTNDSELDKTAYVEETTTASLSPPGELLDLTIPTNQSGLNPVPVPLQKAADEQVVELNQSFDWGEIQWMREDQSNHLGESQLIRPQIEPQNHDQLKDESTVAQSVIPETSARTPTQRMIKRVRQATRRLFKSIFGISKTKNFMEDTPVNVKEYVLTRN